jgi:hypothetical protein
MKPLQIADLRELVEHRQRPCISMYLPTHRTGRDTREDPIRLKNAIGQAKERLGADGITGDHASALLEPASELVTSQDFWLHQSDGLAVFVSPELFRYYRVPTRVEDEVVVTDHFCIKQLTPLFAEDGRFYILALSQKRVRLYEATRLGIHERTVPDMLKSIKDLRQYDEVEEHLREHTVASMQAGRTDVILHGQGGIADKTQYKQDVIRYVRTISRTLEKYLADETAPLVLAAVEYEQAFYRQVNSYQALLNEGVTGNPDLLNEQQLHEAAWNIMEPHFAQARQISLGHYADLSNTDKTSDRVEVILPSAHQGRVRTLFIRRGAQVWGRFDPDTPSVATHDQRQENDTDLVDLATVQVLEHQGMIYALEANEMPTAHALAAMFRY